jgi:tRNA-2-methylthio-N6-dimethylallyladenosine synthase
MLNTCTVRDHADVVVKNRVHRLRHDLSGRPVKIGILGCMASSMKSALLNDPALKPDFVVGPDSYRKLPEILKTVVLNNERTLDADLSDFETYPGLFPAHKEGPNAFVAIMRGCDNYCAYCIVPYTRGRERSRSPRSLLKEIRKLSALGYSQVTLLGQNVNSYRYDGMRFPALLERILAGEGVPRIRFMSPHPKDFPESLIRLLASEPRICPHVHLPLQSGSDAVLKRMNRRYTAGQYLELADRIRAAVPGIALTTDIIAGFPSETDREFSDTLRVVERVRFDAAFVFRYSERPGTPASKTLSDDVPEPVKIERVVALNALQKKISLEVNQTYTGRILELLLEKHGTKKSPDDFQGRSPENKRVIMPPGPYRVGDFVRARVVGASANTLFAEPL